MADTSAKEKINEMLTQLDEIESDSKTEKMDMFGDANVVEESPKPDEHEVQAPSPATSEPEVENFYELGGIKRSHNLSNVTEIKLDLLDIEPLDVPEINDSKGILSKRVRTFMETYNVSVVPLEAVKMPQKVVKLRDYKITEMGGKKYASSMTDTNDRAAVIEFAGQLRDKYANTGFVDESVMKTIVVDEKPYKVPKFNHYELSILYSVLVKFDFKCYVDFNGDIRINIGGADI